MVLLAFAEVVSGQDPQVRRLSIAEGLPQSQVVSVLQDRDGFLWLGTNAGIGRYDGREVTAWTGEDGLANDVILDIVEAPDGDVWFATMAGVSRFDGQELHAVRGLEAVRVNALTVDTDGTIWAGTDNGVFEYRDGAFVASLRSIGEASIKAALTSSSGSLWLGTEGAGAIRVGAEVVDRFGVQDGLPSPTVLALAEDRDGMIWFGTDRGVAVYDGTEIRRLASEGLPHPRVRSLLATTSGGLWVGTDQGPARWTQDGFQPFAVGKLEDIPVWSLAEDHEGTVHLGTSGQGLISYSPSQFTHIDTALFGGRSVWAIAQDGIGATWFGIEGGLMRLEGGALEDVSKETGLDQTTVRFIHPEAGGDLAIGTREGVLRLRRDGFVVSVPVAVGSDLKEVRAMASNREGRLVVATLGHGAFREEQGELRALSHLGVPADANMYDVLVDHKGRMWFATDKGLGLLDENGYSNFNKRSGLPSDFVLTLAEDSDGTLWAGTHSGGLAILDLNGSVRKPRFDILSEEDGLSNSIVLFTRFDSSGDLWVGTNDGLNRVDVWRYHRSGDKEVRTYGPSEGFHGIEANLHAVLAETGGRMWFGHVLGVSVLDPYATESNPGHPITRITDMRIHFKHRDWGHEIDRYGLPLSPTISHKENYVSFDYVGLSFRSTQSVLHRYRLLGFDEDWSPAEDQRMATFSNLPAGTYTFEVQASWDGVTWPSPAATMTFSVAPPFWATWWFRTVIVLFSGLSILVAVRWRTIQIETTNRRLEEEVGLRTAELEQEVERRQETMKALKESEEQFRYLVENVNDVIFATTPDGTITYMSPAIEPVAGAKAEFLIGENLSLLLDAEEADRHRREWEELADGNVRTGEYRVGGGMAESRWIRVSEKATIENGVVVGVQGVLTDITRQKTLENRLLQSNKLESIGQLAAGIAHEINTPIQFVSSNAAFLKECTEDLEELPARLARLLAARGESNEALDQAIIDIELHMAEIELAQVLADMPLAVEESLDGLNRIAEIVAAMKQFSHPGSKEKRLCDIRQLLENTAMVSRNSWTGVAEIAYDMPDDLPMVLCVASELSQVFLNMIVNAAHALESGDRSEEGLINIGARDLDHFVEVTIQDNGVGIPEDVLERIFDPFFTTKEVGMGTGQGLAISRDVIVTRHGGTLDVASEPGRGTRFTIKLPKVGATEPI